jgi:hypothetical protein
MQHARKLRNAYRISVGKSEEKRQLGRNTRRWKCTVKMKIDCEGVNCTHIV